MSTKAEQLITEIQALPQAELREVWEAVNHLAAQVIPLPADAREIPPPCSSTDAEEAEDEAAFFAALAELRHLGRIGC
jgi:hypothetical protein